MKYILVNTVRFFNENIIEITTMRSACTEYLVIISGIPSSI